jgi:serine/threonine protein kinase
MNIHSGTSLGPYEVLSQIGAGGMGVVWQARDTRLDRLVAIKVLPAELSSNALPREIPSSGMPVGISPDGKRILTLADPVEPVSSMIHMIQNWYPH